MTGKITLLFLLGIALIGIWALRRTYRKEGKLTGRIIRAKIFRIPKFRISVALLALLYIGIFSFAYQSSLKTSASVVISLNYDEASKGLNANGTRYNMSEIISDEVVERAIEKGALEGVTVKELKACLSVAPLIDGSSYDEDYYHISTEFLVTFQANQYTGHLDAENVVRLIGFAYKDFYIDTYADNFDLLDITINCEEDFADMDYLDIVQYLNMQVQKIQNYMYGLANESSSYISSDGESFLSLAGEAENIGNVQIGDNLRAYLLDNGISKDAERYIGRLEYDNMLNDYSYQKAKASFDVRNEAVAMYSEEMTRIVLVPTWDSEGEYYMGRTKVGIDTLSLEAQQSSRVAADYFKGIETNKATIKALEEAARSGDDAYSDQLIEKICSEIMSLADAAAKIGQEYSETRMNKCISSSVMDNSFAKYVLICAVLYVLFYLTASAWIKEKKSIGFRNL